jgi:hypothetical protein
MKRVELEPFLRDKFNDSELLDLSTSAELETKLRGSK